MDTPTPGTGTSTDSTYTRSGQEVYSAIESTTNSTSAASSGPRLSKTKRLSFSMSMDPRKFAVGADNAKILVDEIYDYIIEFAFSSAVKSDPILSAALKNAIREYITRISTGQFDALNMREATVIATDLYIKNIENLHRKSEERLCFEAAFLLLVTTMRPESSKLFLTEIEFLEEYPDFTVEALGDIEFKKLFRFRNVVKVCMQVLPAFNNKDRILDLATRLIEGKEIKRVNGSGATRETRRRVTIILKEGNLTVSKRPPRKDKDGKSDDDTSKMNQKRSSSFGDNDHTSSDDEGANVCDETSAPEPEVHQARVYKKRQVPKPSTPFFDDSNLVNGTLIDEITSDSINTSSASSLPFATYCLADSSDWLEFPLGKIDDSQVLRTQKTDKILSLSSDSWIESYNGEILSGSGVSTPHTVNHSGGICILPTTLNIINNVAGDKLMSGPPAMPSLARASSQAWYNYPLPDTSVDIPILRRFPSAPQAF